MTGGVYSFMAIKGGDNWLDSEWPDQFTFFGHTTFKWSKIFLTGFHKKSQRESREDFTLLEGFFLLNNEETWK